MFDHGEVRALLQALEAGQLNFAGAFDWLEEQRRQRTQTAGLAAAPTLVEDDLVLRFQHMSGASDRTVFLLDNHYGSGMHHRAFREMATEMISALQDFFDGVTTAGFLADVVRSTPSVVIYVACLARGDDFKHLLYVQSHVAPAAPTYSASMDVFIGLVD